MIWKSYLLSVLLILVLRFLDLFITFKYTPDLTSEWNPLVSVLGLSWAGFIAIQAVVLGFIAGMMAFYFNRKPVIVEQRGLGLHDFVYVYFFGKLRPWRQRVFTMPTNIGRHLVFNGFIFMSITIGISVFAVLNNLLLIVRHNAYEVFLFDHYRYFLPAVFIGITIGSVYVFFVREYRVYQRQAEWTENHGG
jgi:hypothetical protein